MRKSIYLVAGADTESHSVLAAFEASRDAEALVKACIEWESKRPTYPDKAENTPENDQAFDRANKAMNRFRNKHPGGRGAWVYDTFAVSSLRLQPPSKKEGGNG